MNTEPECPNVQPLPGGLIDDVTYVPFAGSGSRMKMLWMLFTEMPLSVVGTTIGFTATVNVACWPCSTDDGEVVWKLMS